MDVGLDWIQRIGHRARAMPDAVDRVGDRNRIAMQILMRNHGVSGRLDEDRLLSFNQTDE
jgi:hypothetical protein